MNSNPWLRLLSYLGGMGFILLVGGSRADIQSDKTDVHLFLASGV